MQTKINSLKESTINIAIGFMVALAAQMVIFPLFGFNRSAQRSYAQLKTELEKYQKEKLEIITLIKNDAYAISFQTMGQYRTALVKRLTEAA